MKKQKASITTPLLATTTVLLIAANLVLGIILLRQSRQSIRSLMQARMLDVSNTAACMLDGDTLRDLNKGDENTPEYQQIRKILRAFQDNIELEYIYAIRDEGGRFSFTIDPSDDPGEFGEEIAYTEALDAAAHGKAAVDQEPYTDRWGRFYSSYSPVFDSNGNVAGIIGVDFSANWYDSAIRTQFITIICVCTASTVVGILLAFTVSARIRRRFDELYGEMNSLAEDFADLNKLIRNGKDGEVPISHVQNAPEKKKPPEEQGGDLMGDGMKDEIAVIGRQIRALQSDLRQYITYVHNQAYTDAMTGVGSKTAYLQKVSSLERQIAAGKGDFAVAVFDINGLKKVNDNYGHEMGDKFIIGAAEIIKDVFGAEDVYRIGGDEFIAISEHRTQEDMDRLFDMLENKTVTVNAGGAFPLKLTFSKGAAVYRKSEDEDYRTVFRKADEAMYTDKKNRRRP